MRDLVRIELYKIVKRKDFWLMLSMIFIPIMYAVGLASNSSSFTYEGDGKVSAFGYASEMMIFVYMCFIYFIILSVCVIRSLKGEIENKSLLLYAQRVNNRKKIYSAKWTAYVILLFLIFAIFLMVSVAFYEIFLSGRGDIASGRLLQEGEAQRIVCSIASVLLCFIFTVSVALALGAYLKSFQAMGVYIFFWLGLMYIKEFTLVKYLAPIHYVEMIIDPEKNANITAQLLYLAVFVTIVSVTGYALGCRKFVRSDI